MEHQSVRGSQYSVSMSQHESPHQPHYSFGRDRYRDPQHNDSAQYGDSAQFSDSRQYGVAEQYSAAQQYSAGVPGQVQGARGELVPPPPAGHRSLFTVVILYLVVGFMLLWTGASVAVTLEAIGEQDGTQSMIGMFMSAGSLAI